MHTLNSLTKNTNILHLKCILHPPGSTSVKNLMQLRMKKIGKINPKNSSLRKSEVWDHRQR